MAPTDSEWERETMFVIAEAERQLAEQQRKDAEAAAREQEQRNQGKK